MLKVVAYRCGAALAVLFVCSLMAVCILRVAPGDAATLILGQEATPQAVEAMRQELGLNTPLVQQYFGWLGGVLTGNLGESRLYAMPVTGVIAQAFPVTLLLSLYATALALVISLGFGIAAGLHPNSWVDVVARILTQFGSAMPAFWLAIMLMLFFSSYLEWFPVSGYVPLQEDPLGCIASLTLPACALAAGECGVLLRTVRNSVLEAASHDSMLSTQVKGLTRVRVICIYILKGALVAPVTSAGMQMAKLLGGTVAIESIFALPGLGRLLLTSVEQRDLMLVLGVVIVIAACIVLVNLLCDLVIMALNPGARQKQS